MKVDDGYTVLYFGGKPSENLDLSGGHNCGACYHACQYAPPHEFAVNVPRAMAEVRVDSYERYAWPPAFGALYRSNGLAVALALAGGLALFLVLGLLRNGSLLHAPLAGDFYAVFPHDLMAGLFGAMSLGVVLALGIGAVRFWREVSPGRGERAGGRRGGAPRARADLPRRGGHGEGCNEESDRYTLARRRFHHLTFYGFMLCFAATSVATLWHCLLGRPAPYPFLSLPVVARQRWADSACSPGRPGCSGSTCSATRARPTRRSGRWTAASSRCCCSPALTGFAVLLWRDSGAMGLLLAVHLGVVLALFATLPYGKFAHAVYRVAALLESAIEKRQPGGLRLGPD